MRAMVNIAVVFHPEDLGGYQRAWNVESVGIKGDIVGVTSHMLLSADQSPGEGRLPGKAETDRPKPGTRQTGMWRSNARVL